ncbi:MAG TPA: hypothetical protein DCG75_08450 [Bacteroidales bacterium]|nr:hypothetical protein [Bacteroidales bacterium]
MNFKLALFILFSLAALNLRAQIDSSNHFEELHHSEYELGFSNGIVYDFGESELAYGLHLHFVKTIGKSDKIGIGLGYERIFDDHKHNAVSVIFLFRPIEHFSLNLAPGVSWLATESNSEKFSMHLESLYEWELGNFHFGPLLGVATNMEDFHASLGIHIAIGF